MPPYRHQNIKVAILIGIKQKKGQVKLGGLGKKDTSGKIYAVFSLLVLRLGHTSTDTFVLLCFSSGSRGGYNKGKCTGSNVRCLYIYINISIYIILLIGQFCFLQHTTNGRLHSVCNLVWCIFVAITIYNELCRALCFPSNA